MFKELTAWRLWKSFGVKGLRLGYKSDRNNGHCVLSKYLFTHWWFQTVSCCAGGRETGDVPRRIWFFFSLISCPVLILLLCLDSPQWALACWWLSVDIKLRHTHTHARAHTHSVGLLWTIDQPDTETSSWQHTVVARDIRTLGEIRTRNPCPRSAIYQIAVRNTAESNSPEL
jgi:hypothetical protein